VKQKLLISMFYTIRKENMEVRVKREFFDTWFTIGWMDFLKILTKLCFNLLAFDFSSP
jgi:hypothetical protein